MHKKLLLFIFCILYTASCPVFAEENLAKRSQNPIANLISVPFENNIYLDVGPTDKTANVMLIKPVYPITLGEVNLINRTIIPLIYLEGQDSVSVMPENNPSFGPIEVFPGTDDKFGLGNIQYQGFFSPAATGNVIWGLGPVVQLPTNTDNALGSDTVSIGPTAVALMTPGKWVVGGLTQNLWTIAKDSGEEDINKFSFQYFLNYNLDNGWYLTSSPTIAANWEADSDDTWTLPVGGGAGKLVRFGEQPVDFKLATYYYVEKPEFGPEWNILFSVKLLFPKK